MKLTMGKFKTMVAAAALLVAGSTMAHASEAFTQAPMPYAKNALNPIIDTQTMDIHFNRHHAGYVNNLNAAVATTPELQGLSLEEMMANISQFSTAVRNNGGGHYNHDLFWRVMAPVGTGGSPSAPLLAAINAQFGSLQAMQQEFNQAAATRFGSGWAWLIVNHNGELQVTSTANQDNPLMDVVEHRGAPILALDVWEHAYYLRYQNRRGDYIGAWWEVVNWHEVNRLFAATQGSE